jgi:hypothetical protein
MSIEEFKRTIKEFKTTIEEFRTSIDLKESMILRKLRKEKIYPYKFFFYK